MESAALATGGGGRHSWISGGIMDNRFDTYLKALAAGYREGGTEHTGRTALENLLNAFKANAAHPRIQVQHEGGREGDKGAPDFKIKRDGMILGYVEVKTIGENLDKILKSDQIKKYRTLSDNIIVTDYLHFIRIDGTGKVLGRAELAYPSDLEGRTLRIVPEKADAVSKVLTAFFSEPPQGLGRAQQLALALATRSKMLRDFLTEELIRQEKVNKEGRLHALFDVFRQQVFHELSTKEFADAFAQMLSYGLFLAKLNVPEPKEGEDPEAVALDNVRKFIPGSFRLIRELVRFLEEMQEAEYDDVKWVIDEILSIVNGLAIANIREDLSFRNRKAVKRKVRAGDEEEHRLFERDPFIYFYEDFLKAYDKDTRKGRGVYYTPPPVVNFIVRAVDDILKDTFKIADGLADHKKVTVLDFAAGTGTFLLEVMQKIFDNIGGPESGKAASVVREHMTKNLYGFEYLIAPYTIAHLKLSQYLKDKGHPLGKDERLQVYLTNTLEPIEPQKSTFLPELSNEVEEAQKVKEKPILVILGNPPYSGHSKNKGAWISAAIDGYKYTVERVQTETDKDGNPVFSDVNKPLGERNPKWLNDDYVKFIRFAQLKMDAVDEGVVGIITNHSWLDNPTFRGMRQSLTRSFDQIYVLDLHGNFKKKEVAPDGSKDENVFDIEQGVAISVFVKRPNLTSGVWRGDIWGRRLEKYKIAAEETLAGLGLDAVLPARPHYLFQAQDVDMREEYEAFRPISEMMPLNSVGLVTSRDKLAIAFTDEEIRERTLDFVQRSVEDARAHYRLGEDVRDWRVDWAQQDVRKGGSFIELTYRPFDKRHTFYTGRSRGFHVYPRNEVSREMLRDNVALITSRLTKGEEFRHIQITDRPAEVICMSPNTSNNGFVFPLRGENDVENFSSDFRTYLDTRYDHHYSPEEILGYIYAVLHAPGYRSRYAEFLRIDFPRIPFAETNEHFEALSHLGWTLVQAHLMRDLPRRGLGDFHGRGGNQVEHVRWSAEDQRVSVNKVQSFAPVPEAVWSFHIGGYQVIDKYLKSRKGRRLSLDEINHVARICDALSFTIDQMAAIDLAYAQAFPDRG
jgi:Type ISP C-terminal specificity domain/N-6 DNA Methylase